MRRLSEFVLRHRKLVVLAWLLLFLAGGAVSQRASDRLTIDFSLPGQPGYEAEKQILQTYGNGGMTQPIIAAVTDQHGDVAPAAASTFAKLQQRVPGIRVITDPGYVTKDGKTRYAVVFYPFPKSFTDNYDKPVRNALAAVAPAGVQTSTTSYDQLGNGGDSNGPGVLVETLLGGLGALAVLAFVFASFLALVPLVVAAVSILTTFLVLLGLTYVTDVSFIVQFLVALVGLGVAVDYSLLVVTRWREEREHGRDNHDAVVVAMETAGHAVVFSGVTVAIGLLALVVLPVPFLRSMGYGGALIPLVSVLSACTLLPAILGGIGPRVDWPKIRHENNASRVWSRWAAAVVRRRWIAVGAAGLLLALLIVPFFSIKVGLANTDALAKSGPAYEAFHTLREGGVSGGVLTPMEVLVKSSAADRVAAQLRHTDGVSSAVVQPRALDRAGTSVVVVVPDRETVNSTSLGPVHAVQDAVAANRDVIGVGGAGPTQIDYVNAVYKNFPWALAVIVVLTFILLARAFRSLLLPLKAVLLNLVSLGATFGAMVAFWQWGHGSQAVFGIDPTGAITFWLPVLVFAFLYGLSMDYEVFILARVREEFDRTGSTDRSVVEGIGRTGRLVTSAALILFLAFLSLASGPQTDIKVLATGLGFGILLDATVIRSLLVPALVSLFGRINWVLPAWAARPLRVEPSNPAPAADVPPEPAPVAG
ncbi:MAG TPA: MMPL family transporter [Mycobacteriales bacterium]|nr:MMPL family transporter [Mycobacteriales bacterium]